MFWLLFTCFGKQYGGSNNKHMSRYYKKRNSWIYVYTKYIWRKYTTSPPCLFKNLQVHKNDIQNVTVQQFTNLNLLALRKQKETYYFQYNNYKHQHNYAKLDIWFMKYLMIKIGILLVAIWKFTFSESLLFKCLLYQFMPQFQTYYAIIFQHSHSTKREGVASETNAD